MTVTAVEAVSLKEVHKEATRIYRECKNVRNTLLRHIQTSLEDKYIEYLTEKYTGLIGRDTPTALEHLFSNYGKVTSEEVKQTEAEVLNI